MRLLTCLLSAVLLLSGLVHAQVAPASIPDRTSARYLDSLHGLTADELVARALGRNGELLAAQQQVAAARGNVTQAKLRPNPSFELGALRQVGGSDNSVSLGASVPLELFGRRERRVDVATRSLS